MLFLDFVTNFQFTEYAKLISSNNTCHFIWLFFFFFLKAEGIFRINAENSQEEHVRSQLNTGVVPCRIDVHCLAGLIKVGSSSIANHIPRPIKCIMEWIF